MKKLLLLPSALLLTACFGPSEEAGTRDTPTTVTVQSQTEGLDAEAPTMEQLEAFETTSTSQTTDLEVELQIINGAGSSGPVDL